MLKHLILFLLTGTAAALAAAEPVKFPFPGFTVTAIQDAPTNMPGTLFTRQTPDTTADPVKLQKSYPASFNVFLIETDDGKKMLVDTGAGRGGLTASFQKLGIAPDGITDILLTHSHGDHTSGLLTKDDRAAFPRAMIRLSRPELDFWENNGLTVRLADACRGRWKIVKSGDMIGSVLVLSAAGHTPGHLAFRIGDAVFIGDLIHAEGLQFAHPDYGASYDRDPAAAAHTRKALLHHAAKRGLIVFGAHLPFPGAGKVTENQAGSFSFQPYEINTERPKTK